MRLKFILGIVLGIVFCSGLWACNGADQQIKTSVESEVAQTKITQAPITIGASYTFPSKIMGENREINVWLPPKYNESVTQKFPVLYVIDGGIEQDFHHISGLAQLGSISAMYEDLIVVGIKTQNRLNELAHPASDPRYIHPEPRVGKSQFFSEYVRTEVLPFIEDKYRVSDRRVIVGESLAGLFITEMFLKHPNSFTDYIAISPSLWWDDKNLAKQAPELIAKHSDAARKLYLTMGDEGGTMQGGLDLVMAAIHADTPKGLEWKYVDRRASAQHSTIYHGASLDALLFMFGIPVPDYGPDPWYLVEGGQPEDDEK